MQQLTIGGTTRLAELERTAIERIKGWVRMLCDSCGVELTAIDIALTKKVFGVGRDRAVKYHFCIDCVGEYLDKSHAEMLDMIENYKQQGCALFG